MQHLSIDELAALVDEPMTAEQERHVEECEECRTELDALREQLEQLRALPELRAPVTGWPALESRLREERLVRGGAVGGRFRWAGPASRAAAAIALFVAGGVTGGLLRGGSGAGDSIPLFLAERPATVAEAEEALAASEAAYIQALAAYGELTGTDAAVDPLSRLAALEGIVLTTRAALNESPADPVINGYHLAALSQREAMLRQISSEDDGWF